MKLENSSIHNIAYKWLSCGIIVVVAYYWLLTFGVVIFSKTVATIAPNQTLLYRTFARQNWRLFAFTKVYNRQMNFIVRDKKNPAMADTTDLVQYLLVEKRAYAPFNNYQDALEKILYLEMNGIEAQMNKQHKIALDKYPAKPAIFYMEKAYAFTQADSLQQQNINNVIAYGKYMMQREKKDTTAKEYQINIIHKYIFPTRPQEPTAPGSDEQLIFISTYKPF